MTPSAQDRQDRSALTRLEQRLMSAVTARETGRRAEDSTEELAES
jgi:hypothetical protein